MKHLLTAVLAVCMLIGIGNRALAEDVEIKGAHLCCGSCAKAAEKLLAKVDGVSDVKISTADKTIAFKAADKKAAKKGINAILKGGFFGTITCDAKAMKVESPKAGEKSNRVVVAKVHVCCGACQKAINGLFEGSKVAYKGSGAQRDVIIEGDNLEASAVLESLRKAGFNGSIGSKKKKKS